MFKEIGEPVTTGNDCYFGENFFITGNSSRPNLGLVIW